MRKLLLFFIVIFSAHPIYAQTVTADPAITQFDLVDPDGITPAFANFIAPSKVLQIKIPVFNLHQANTIPAGSSKLKINLGRYLSVDPSFILANASLNNYFKWTSSLVGGNVEINGDVIAPIPGDFIGTAIFDIKAGTILGTSEIFADFQTTNHNTTITLADEDINNNTASLQYTVTTNPVVPVTFTKFSLTKNECLVKVNFSTENPVNVSHYELEISKDAINFLKIGELPAVNRIDYNFDVTITSNLEADQLFFRIKSVDKDLKFQFSVTRTIAGMCDEKKMTLLLFPNPVAGEKNEIVIKRKEGIFNGQYNISLSGITGKLIKSQQYYLNNVNQFNYVINNLPKGQFILHIQSKDKADQVNIQFQRL